MPAATTYTSLTGYGTGWGIGKEVTYGTAIAPTFFIPFTSESVKESTTRLDVKHTENRFTHDTNNGGRKSVSGDVSFYVEPETVGMPLSLIFGQDLAENIPHATPVNTTLGALVTAGATSITLTSATGIAAGDFFMIDSGTSLAELVKVGSVATNVVTIANAGVAAFAHSNGAAVAKAVGQVVKHVFSPAATSTFFTSEFKYGSSAAGKRVAGCMETGLSFEFADDVLSSSASVSAKEMDENATATAVAFPSTMTRTFTYRDVEIDVGTLTGYQINVLSGSINIKHEPFTDDYRLGSDTVASMPSGYFYAEATLELVYNADATLEAWFQGTATQDVVIRFIGDVVTGTTKRQMTFTLPRAKTLEASPAISVGERITRSVSFKVFHDRAQAGNAKNISVELNAQYPKAY